MGYFLMNRNMNDLIYSAYKDMIYRGDDKDKMKSSKGVLLLQGMPGSGKTSIAVEYCKSYPASLYFSFARKEERMALKLFCMTYPNIFSRVCTNWHDFFDTLRTKAAMRRCVIFFDDVDERNDKHAFFSELNTFVECQKNDRNALIVLLLLPESKYPYSCNINQVPDLRPAQVLRLFPKLPPYAAFCLFVMTGGRYALIKECETCCSLEECLRRMFRMDSVYYRLIPGWMDRCFRSPESYNTLLYGLASGYSRISELSLFSGYPNNKCEKYLVELIGKGFVIKEKKPGRQPTYRLSSGYFEIWYKFLFPAITSGPENTFSEKAVSDITAHLQKIMVPNALHTEALRWLDRNRSKVLPPFSTVVHADENVSVNSIVFDRIEQTKSGTVFVLARERFYGKEWPAIEAATAAKAPFYRSFFVLCTLQRFPDSYWAMNRRYDNMFLVQVRSMV